ncbi:MAG: multiheme c-type cytochrome, partial [Planctomycetota bacterium]|nr:multiheme c-type cytochrome [Planctomycetota bacterium]
MASKPPPTRSVLGPWQRLLVRLLIPGALALTATGLFLFFSDGAGSASSLSLIIHIAGGALLFFVMLGFVVPHAHAQRKRRPSIRFTGFLLTTACIVLMGTGIWPLLEEVAARRTWARTLHVAAGAAMLFFYYVHRRSGINRLSRRRFVQALIAVVVVGGLFLLYDRVDPEKQLRYLGAERIGIEHTLARTPGNTYVAVEEVDDSAGCIECHKTITEEWSRSAHRHASMTNPFYRATVEEMRRQVGPDNLDKTKFCAGCHDPALLFTGEMDKPDLDFEGRAARTGLSCVACHTIQPGEGTRGNADYMFEPRRIYAWERSDDPKLREAHAVLLRLKPEAHKESLRPPGIETSEYCAICHKAEIAPEVNGWHFFRAQDEYDAWHGSGISMNNALSFYHPPEAKRCHDCHMPLVPDPQDPTADARGMVRSHLFAAANTGLAALRGDKAMIERMRVFLRTACRIDITAVDVTPADGREPAGVFPVQAARPQLAPGDLVEAHVVLRTLGVGHMFPGGTIDSNEVWIEFAAAMGDDEPFWTSGGIDEDSGLVDPTAEFYRAWVADENGDRVITRLGTQVRTRVYVKTIPPGAADVSRYRFRIPEGAPGKALRLTARLRYRKFMREYVDFVFPKDKVHEFLHDDGS